MKKFLFPLAAAFLTFGTLQAEEQVLEDVFTGGAASMPTYFGSTTIPAAKYNSTADFEATSIVTGAEYKFPAGAFISGANKCMIIPFGPTSVTIKMPEGCTKINILGEASNKTCTVSVYKGQDYVVSTDFTAYKAEDPHVIEVTGGETYTFTNTATASANWWIKTIQYTISGGSQSQEATVSGTVKSPDGTNLAGAGVALNKDGNQVGYATTDASGAYSIKVTNPEGSYTLAASLNGYFPSNPSDVDLSNGSVASQDFTLVPTIVQGTVKAGDQTIEGASITMLLGESTIATRTSDSEGNFIFEHLLNYDQIYTASVNAEWYELQTLEVKFDAQTREPVVLNIALRKESVNLMLSGNVFDSDSARLEGATITLYSGQLEVEKTLSDQDGFYYLNIEDPEGEYKVSGDLSGYFPGETENFKFNGENVEEKDIILVPTVLQGTVMSQGEPVQDAKLDVKIGDETVAQCHISNEGTFELNHVLDYSKIYTASFTAPDYEAVNQEVKFDAATKAPVILNIELIKSGISDLRVNESDAQYYDLLGRKVNNPESGLYIKRENGKAAKVTVSHP